MAVVKRTSGLLVASDMRAAREPQSLGCAVCQATFSQSEFQAYQHHVVQCAKRHRDELEELSPRVQAPGIFGETDTERWAREHRDDLREGRKKL